jgi:hypothetical protein
MSKLIVTALLLLAGAVISIEGTKNGSSSDVEAQEKIPLAVKPSTLLDCSVISPLDKSIQHRFTETNRGFGLERIMIRERGYHTPVSMAFRTEAEMIGMLILENEEEKEAVAEIEESGLNMALYLASRKILAPRPDEDQLKNSPMFHFPLRGPVGITRNSGKSDWPEALSLWNEARKAMQDFESEKTATNYEFYAGGKTFIARPVRAQESCLKCHTPEKYQQYVYDNNGGAIRPVTSALPRQISAGDPIGVLLYAYVSSARSNLIKKP